MPISLLLLLLFLLLVYWCWSRRDMLIASWKLPGPVALPFIGSAFLFICGQEEIFGRVLKILTTYESPVIRLWLGTKMIIFVQSPKFIEEVIKNPDLQEKGAVIDPTKVIFGEGLIAGSGPKWRSHRKAIVPNFSPKVVEEYADMFRRHGEILLELLRPSAEREERIAIDHYLHFCCFDIEVIKNPDLQEKGAVIDPTKVIFGEGLIAGSGPKWRSHRKAIVPNFSPKVVEEYADMFRRHGEILLELLRPSAEREERIAIDHYLHFCCFDIVSETLIDRKSNTQLGENVELAADTVAVYKSVFLSMIKPWRQTLQRATGQCFDDNYASRLRDFFQTAIDKKRAEMKERELAELPAADRGSSTLERLERAGFSSTDEDLCFEFNNLFIASFDTVAIEVSFALRMLAMNPELQKRAAEEALSPDGLEGRCGPGKLPFMERCVLETVRLFPIAPFLTRACKKTFYLSDGTMIPAGSSILMTACTTHRSPEEWEEPLTFQPDRFLPGADRHAFAFLPFSYGLRGCVGKSFAMMCCKSLLCQILQQFEFSCDPGETVAGMNLSCDISVREIGGNHVTIRRRGANASF